MRRLASSSSTSGTLTGRWTPTARAMRTRGRRSCAEGSSPRRSSGSRRSGATGWCGRGRPTPRSRTSSRRARPRRPSRRPCTADNGPGWRRSPTLSTGRPPRTTTTGSPSTTSRRGITRRPRSTLCRPVSLRRRWTCTPQPTTGKPPTASLRDTCPSRRSRSSMRRGVVSSSTTQSSRRPRRCIWRASHRSSRLRCTRGMTCSSR